MTIYLGIDGGGTGCRAAAADRAGVLLGRGAAGPANIFTDPEGARANLLAAAEAALAGRRMEEAVAVLGVAGANVSGAAGRLGKELRFAKARVVSDALIAARGALGAGDGVAATLGTGSIYAAQRGSAVRFIGGWGFLLSDHGSGARMGRALLEAALLAHDGLAPATPLLAAVVAEAGGPEGLVAFAQGARPVDFARYAPRLLKAAVAGDAGAEAVLAQADGEVAAALDLLLAEGPAPVCFLGGLGPAFAARLGARYGALIRPPLGSALDGALAMAREL